MRLPWIRRRPADMPLDGAEHAGGQDQVPGSVSDQPVSTLASAPTGPDAQPADGGAAACPPVPPAAQRTPAQAMAEASAALDLQALYPPVAEPVPAAAPGAGRGQRRGLIPSWLPWAAGGVAGVIILAVVVGFLVARSSVVRVPSLAGMDRKTAEARLGELGLKLVIGDRRFSATAPVGTIIDQDPKSGTQVEDGSAVTVALSGGSEVFAMPDVLGLTLDDARAKLRERGLTVEFQTAVSDKEQGTVIASVPSPGQQVQTGDTIRLTVAAGTSGTDTLLPADLKGLTFVIDPAPMPAGAGADATLDVSLRVRALLEASGARVVVTRSLTDTGDAANTLARAKRAKEASATALVGLSVTPSGATGLAVATLPNTGMTGAIAAKSGELSQAIVGALKSSFPGVTSSTVSNDIIVSETGVPAVRVRLGSSQSSTDRLSFSDPQWADNVARSIYRGIGQVFGAK